jgi:ABC-type amino acid transport substrate-binding protein
MQLTSKQRRLVLGASGLLACWPAVGAGPGHGAVPATLRIVTSHLPPLAIDNGGQTPGALHEVVTELCKRLQLAPALAFMPWKRAIFLATAGPATLRARGTEADFVYSAALTRTAAWLAGSLDFTEADAARFQRAMHELKADGSYFAILKRYQLG